MDNKIKDIVAREIIDSRGTPTVEAEVILEGGVKGVAAVPSGASTGMREAIELRDNDPKRFGGKGVLKAVESINKIIKPALKGLSVSEQATIDKIMIDLDGTKNKSKLGANAILAVSLAASRASSNFNNLPLYNHLGGAKAQTLPIPLMNVINGGKHADNNLDIQEFMIVPTNFKSFKEALRAGCEIYANLKSILKGKGMNTSVGDEGGFAPNLKSNIEAIDILLEAIEKSGYKPGKDVYIAIDAAASSFYENGKYSLTDVGIKDSSQLIDYYEKIITSYPIYSFEDPIAENDYDGWKEFTIRFKDRILIIGDDVFVTNKEIFAKGIEEGIANGILIKLNQIGTLTETLETIKYAVDHNYKYVISHRSGETEDTFIADLAVATNSGFIKSGAPARTERVCKYNRLIRIEEELGEKAIYNGALLGTSLK
ncbi:MAG: phosphopyruvate hydratase [Caldisericia bacterium]|jgi:enolase|nr:phosphopyruvate hydratase [Caldisericia bacterium]MDD5689564.1 phosphopyruvate hydratase [Caldisericia bacterium]HOJ16914.1 phosphopyruvate hydratase [Caldisericia bacterium]HOW02664.1 phosphopyruvate hydratase [Caldisericia bacterium]HPO29557.1 phosphopyruvate hydratase [Caldisericia bacterium]